MQILFLHLHTREFYFCVPCECNVKFTHEYFFIFILSQYLLLVNDFPFFLFLTDYMAVNFEAVDLVVEK